MPIYPFVCDSCGKEEDVVCAYSERDEYKKCPDCGKDRRQIIGLPGMITIHDCQTGGLYHRKTKLGDGTVRNTTDGIDSRYYYKNNPADNPQVISRIMNSDKKLQDYIERKKKKKT